MVNKSCNHIKTPYKSKAIKGVIKTRKWAFISGEQGNKSMILRGNDDIGEQGEKDFFFFFFFLVNRETNYFISGEQWNRWPNITCLTWELFGGNGPLIGGPLPSFFHIIQTCHKHRPPSGTFKTFRNLYFGWNPLKPFIWLKTFNNLYFD